MPYLQEGPGKGRRPSRSERIYPPTMFRNPEVEARATAAARAADARIFAIDQERAALLQVRREAIGQLSACGLSYRAVAKLVGVSHETVRYDLRVLGEVEEWRQSRLGLGDDTGG